MKKAMLFGFIWTAWIFGTCIRAEVIVIRSLEWKVADSCAVVRARPMNVYSVDRYDPAWRRTETTWFVTLAISETFKGGGEKTLDVLILEEETPEYRDWQINGTERIAILKEFPTPPHAAAQPRHFYFSEWQIVGGWAMREKSEVTMEGKILRTPAEIETAVRKASLYHATPIRATTKPAAWDSSISQFGDHGIGVECVTHEMAKAVYGHDLMLFEADLEMPFDARLKDVARQWLQDPETRPLGEKLLKLFD